MNVQRDPRDLHVRNGPHRAHAVPEHRVARDFDVALFHGVRRGHRHPHRRDRGVAYGAFIVRADHAVLLTQSISNASFGIYLPEFTGTIYEILSAPVSAIEIVLGYVGAAATKSMILGLIILATARLFVPFGSPIRSGCCSSGADLGHLQPVRLHHRDLGGRLREAPDHSADGHHAAQLPRRHLLLDRHAAAVWQKVTLFNPVVYLVSGFRWSFYGIADVQRRRSAGMTLAFLVLCLAAVSWIFKTGYRLKK